MFDQIPVRIWLLLLIAIAAWVPARYVIRHAAKSPAGRDITKPAEDLSWRSSGNLAKSLGILAALAAMAAFIFTPAAAEFARSPNFVPILTAAIGSFALWSVVKGYTSGVVEPMARGASWEFSRSEQPKRYWASMAWNGLVGGALVFFGVQQIIDAPKQALRDRCHDWKDDWSAGDELAACNRLLAEHPEDDRASVIAARGSAYYSLRKYRQAEADYAAALRLDPKQGSWHYNLGLVHEELGQPERAIGDYEAAIKIDPENKDAFLNRGLIFLDTDRFDAAIADFTQAYRIDPTKVMSLANRGIAYVWKDDVTHAEQDFAVVRKSDPSNMVLAHGDALIAVKRGDLDGGVRFLSDAIVRRPDDAWALAMRASLYSRLGQQGKAQADIKAAQKLKRNTSLDRKS